jgi:hypothetical protein
MGLNRFASIEDRLERLQQSVGRIEIALQDLARLDDPATRELQVWSQWGEDGIVQALVRRVPLGARRFVEFGVETYREANTRFLLRNDHWSGLVIDGSAAHIESIRADTISWRHDLRARCAFVTRENINPLLREEGFDRDLDLLSVDVDGNDYWIWEALADRPRIVVIEYNSVFGPDVSVSVPYRADFQRTAAHPSNLYYGASAAALASLGRQRGYRLVCGNRAGNNLFFVREDVAGELPRRTAAEVWTQSRFREARDANGGLRLLRADQARDEIATLPVVDVTTARTLSLREAWAAHTGSTA